MIHARYTCLRKEGNCCPIMSCHKAAGSGKPRYNKRQCEKLANEILTKGIKDDHILTRLTQIIHCDKKVQGERLEDIESLQYSVEHYFYRAKELGVKKTEGTADINLLHLAISCDRDSVARKLIEETPSLSKSARTDDRFKGQTAFHIAVAKKKRELVELMLVNGDTTDLLSGKARGSSLKGTIMTGETPLSIAVLNCDEDMIRLLKEHRADILQGDTVGNTVLHTIVMYAFYFPENNFHERAIRSLREEIDDRQLTTLMQKQNNKGLTPLQLACQKNQQKVFSYFITLDNVSRFNIDIWGVNETFYYDITELDTVRWREILQKDQLQQDDTRVNIAKEEDAVCCEPCVKFTKITKQHSTLVEISQLPFKAAAEFMEIDIINVLIREKWGYYKYWVYALGLFHFFLMIALTCNTVLKTEAFSLRSRPFSSHVHSRFLAFNILNILVGLLYVLQEVIRRILFCLEWFPTCNLHHNTICRLFFLLFGIALLTDSFWNFHSANNYVRYVALLLGWFNIIFFLRSIKFCSYQAVLFLEIITGDIIRFLPVMVVILVPFTAAAYESYARNSTGFSSYLESVLTLFQWMNGLGELPEVQNELKPGLSITVFVLFVIFFNIILLQTLIALMTNNQLNNINRVYLRRVQRLSMIVLLESMLPNCLLKGLGNLKTTKFRNSSGEERERYHLLVSRANDEMIAENESAMNYPILQKLVYAITHHDTGDTGHETLRSQLSTQDRIHIT